MKGNGRQTATIFINQILKCLLVLFISILHYSTAENQEEESNASNYNDANSSENEDTAHLNDLDWFDQLSGVGPFLVALFILIFILHLLIQPDWMMHSLMLSYLDNGSPIVGSVLDCEDKINKPGVYLVEVCYQTQEHKYANNPSMRFRFPGAFETKNFVRRFEFHRSIAVGEPVVVLLPAGILFPRSGCPREVVEQILQELESRRERRIFIFGVGIVCIIILIVLSILQIVHMEDPHVGWVALVVTIGITFVMAFLFCTDQFLKRKCRTFDAARPMINAEEQRNRMAQKAVTDCKTVAPFSIPLNEFAGHARATERNR